MYGTFVRRVRTSRHLSQRDLAGISGISQSNISAIENDRRVPSADTLNRLLVSCGYELAAVADRRIIACPLPPDACSSEGNIPPRLAGDPPDEQPTLAAGTTGAERARVVAEMLDVVDAVMFPR